jgi:hypothetical protein
MNGKTYAMTHPARPYIRQNHMADLFFLSSRYSRDDIDLVAVDKDLIQVRGTAVDRQYKRISVRLDLQTNQNLLQRGACGKIELHLACAPGCAHTL